MEHPGAPDPATSAGPDGPVVELGPDGPTDEAATAALRRLVELLRHEVGALELLVYRCRVGALLLAAGDARGAVLAGDEIDDASEALGALEATRAVAVADLCARWDLDHAVTLDELAARAPAPYGATLVDVADALRGLVRELAVVRALGEEAGGRALLRTVERSDALALGAHVGYGADASPVALGSAGGAGSAGRFSGRV